MDGRLSFGKIHIIEWLGKSDHRTGRKTYLVLKDLISKTGTRIGVVLHRVSSPSSFIKRLQRIEHDFRASGRIPLLQIETHGDDDGIGLTRENGMTWPELMAALTPLNMATGVRLVVFMASCFGIWGIKMAQPMQRAPFLALLGPNRELLPGEVVRGMCAFYRDMLERRDGVRAMGKLNAIVDQDNTTFAFINCEQLFTAVWDSYFDQTATEEQTEERVNRCLELVKAEHVELPQAEMTRVRMRARDYICDHRARFEESRRCFFMLDIYPENAARFNLVAVPVEADPGQQHGSQLSPHLTKR